MSQASRLSPSDYVLLSSCVQRIQKAADELTAFYRERDPGVDEVPTLDPQDELRTYHVPQQILKDEQILLETYEVSRLPDAIGAIRNDFHLMLTMLKSHSMSEEYEGFIYSLCADSLFKSLKMLDKVCSVLADFSLISRETFNRVEE